MSQVVHFSDSACSLVPLLLDNGKIVPRIGIFVGDSMPPASSSMMFLGTESEGPPLLYFITEIIPPASLNSSNVTLVFGIAHSNFDNPDFDNPDPMCANRYSITVPLEYVLIARGMQCIDQNFVFVVYKEDFDSKTINTPRSATSMPSCLFAIDFPPYNPGAESYERVTNTLEALTVAAYAYLYDEDNELPDDVVSPELRRAQYALLNILCSLQNGSVDGGWEYLQSLVEEINKESISNDCDSDEQVEDESTDEDYWIRIFVSMAKMSYLSSSPITVAPNSQEALEEDHDDLTKSFFNKIMEFNKMGDIFSTVDETNQYISKINIHNDLTGTLDPFSNAVPDSMARLISHISRTEPSILELVRWDWSRREVWEIATGTYPTSDIVKALLLVVAARLNISQQSSPREKAIIKAVKFLTSYADTYPWEVLAMRDALLRYDTAEFSDLISTTDTKSASYLPLIMRQIRIAILDGGWNTGNIDIRLNSIDVRHRALSSMRSILISLLEDSSADDDDKNESRVIESVAATFDTEFLSENTSLLIPTLADIAANEVDLEVGSQDWVDFRRDYVEELLRSSIRGTVRKGLGSF